MLCHTGINVIKSERLAFDENVHAVRTRERARSMCCRVLHEAIWSFQNKKHTKSLRNK